MMTFGFLSGLGGKCVIILRSNNALADFVLLQETYAPKLSAKNEKLQRCPPSIPMFVAYTRYVLPLAGAEHHILERIRRAVGQKRCSQWGSRREGTVIYSAETVPWTGKGLQGRENKARRAQASGLALEIHSSADTITYAQIHAATCAPA